MRALPPNQAPLKNPRAFVLTGAPGVGKTTLLEALSGAGIRCVPEPARPILAEQRARGGEALPELNSKAFCNLVLERAIGDFELSLRSNELTLFDRGIPDSVAYAQSFGLDSEHFQSSSSRHQYNSKVFVLPPWEEIYSNDQERKMSFQLACEFHESICDVYKRLGYDLIIVPRGSIQDRAAFVRDRLSIEGEE